MCAQILFGTGKKHVCSMQCVIFLGSVRSIDIYLGFLINSLLKPGMWLFCELAVIFCPFIFSEISFIFVIPVPSLHNWGKQATAHLAVLTWSVLASLTHD